MPVYEITSPDGDTFEVTAPEGATEDQALAYARSQFKAQPKPEPVAAKPETTLLAPLHQGLTFGWADEFGGLGARLGNRLYGAIHGDTVLTPDEAAERETQRQRDELRQTRYEHPLLSAGLEIGGGIVSGGPAARLAQGWKGLAGLGALEGAVAGAGAANENKVAGAAAGGLLGGVVGAAVPTVGSLVRRGSGFVHDMVQPTIDRMRQEPTTRASRILGDQLQAGGVTPEILRQRMRDLGPQATVSEAGGPAAKSLGQGVLGKDATQRSLGMVEQVFGRRMPGMSQRVRDAVSDTTGVRNRLQESLDALRDNQKAAAGPLYQRAESVPIPMTDRLESILRRPPMRAAFQQAKDAAETVGEELPPWFKMNDLGEWKKVGQLPDMRAWDRMKQGVDRLIDAERDAVTGRLTPKGRDLTILKDQLVSELDTLNPVYARARMTFSGYAATESAMRQGERLLTMKTRDVHQAVKGMTDSEREAFLAGAVEAIREKIGAAVSGEMRSFNFLQQDKVMEKLRAVFPPGAEGTRALVELRRRIDAERVMRETYNDLIKGSQTAMRQQAADRLGGQAAIPKSAEALTAPVRTGVSGVMGRIGQTISQERQPTIDALADLLFTPNNVETVIAELQRRGIPPEQIQRMLTASGVAATSMAPAIGLNAGAQY